MKRALWMAAGVIVWALHFAAIYGITGLACARVMPHVVPWAVGLATLVAAGAAAWIARRGMQRRGDFIDAVAAGLGALALLGILWEGAAIAMVPACVSR